LMAEPLSGAMPVARSEPRTFTALWLETIALRHQIAVLERSRTRRPCFRRIDRLFWILLSRWWRGWRESLMIVQPDTVLRWRREGWSALWGYRSRGRWRGGRPRVSNEVRNLVARMARENFLWGAPRIHGELRMLGFSVSQATVSRYLPPPSRRPRQSWQTFVRNQSMAFGRHEDQEQPCDTESLSLRIWSNWRWLMESVTQIAAVFVGHYRDFGQPQPTLNARKMSLRSAQRHDSMTRGVLRFASAPGGSTRTLDNRPGAALPIRSAPHEARASPWPRRSTHARAGPGFEEPQGLI